MVIAVREGGEHGPYIGFQVDGMLLECGVCTEDAAYRILYTQDETLNLPEHRFAVTRLIDSEHPKHSDEIRIR